MHSRLARARPHSLGASNADCFVQPLSPAPRGANIFCARRDGASKRKSKNEPTHWVWDVAIPLACSSRQPVVVTVSLLLQTKVCALMAIVSLVAALVIRVFASEARAISFSN